MTKEKLKLLTLEYTETANLNEELIDHNERLNKFQKIQDSEMQKKEG